MRERRAMRAAPYAPPCREAAPAISPFGYWALSQRRFLTMRSPWGAGSVFLLSRPWGGRTWRQRFSEACPPISPHTHRRPANAFPRSSDRPRPGHRLASAKRQRLRDGAGRARACPPGRCAQRRCAASLRAAVLGSRADARAHLLLNNCRNGA